MTSSNARRRRIVIMGAAGRDFHNFNVVYRDDPSVEVVAFTAAQIPGIAGRVYPVSLAGPLYPQGIAIEAEASLEDLCATHEVDEVVFAYSDIRHEDVMHIASRTLAAGADFSLLGPKRTMLKTSRPVIAVTAVRTGCGKSAIARWLSRDLRRRGLRVAALRHPMPYGDLARERAQRFASLADLDAMRCTVEEREEYEPHIAVGGVVFAGVDYAEILRQAEAEADVIVWDGGNNDFPFIESGMTIAVADALRPEQAATHHPGETVARMADVLVINKVDTASPSAVTQLEVALRLLNPRATLAHAASPITLDDPAAVRGRRTLVIEDGPTITHGGMPYGAGFLAAKAAGAIIVDPRPSAGPDLRKAFEDYPHIANVLPAVGYNPQQLLELQAAINDAEADVVVSGTPIDLTRLIDLNKRVVRARYEHREIGEPSLAAVIDDYVRRAVVR
jgi:predicted GTPase